MTYDTMTRDDLIATLRSRQDEIERLSLDLHDARNQLQAAWAQLEAIGAGGVDRRLHTGVAVPQEAPSMQPKHATQACSMQPIAACHPEAIRALLAEMGALREALAGVLVDDMLPLLPAEYIAKARAALAQEQGEKA